MSHVEIRRTRRPRPWMAAVTILLLIGPDVGLAAGPRLETSEVVMAHDSVRAGIEALSEREAKQFYLDCSRAALGGRLSNGETAACSIGYDVLLKRHFGGDFHALLAWSRSQPQRGDGGSADGRD
jgi:hypothetical protein